MVMLKEFLASNDNHKVTSWDGQMAQCHWIMKELVLGQTTPPIASHHRLVVSFSFTIIIFASFNKRL